MDNSPQQFSRGDEHLNAALLEYEKLQASEDLHRALAFHRAYLEEQKILYHPKLDNSIVEVQAAHAYMQAQLDLVIEIQRNLIPNQPTSE